MFYGILIDMTVTLIENVTNAVTFFAGLSKTLNVFYLIKGILLRLLVSK